MLDLNDLRLFAHIVDNQGVVRAGRALKLPKSTVSRRLAALEAQLQTPLVKRNCDQFTLTEAGKDVYRHSLDIAALANAAEQFLCPKVSEIGGLVRLSVSSLFSSRLLSAFLSDMSAAHPKVRFAIETTNRDSDQMGDGFDIALRAHNWSLRDSALKQRRICHHPLRIVASPDYLRRRGFPSCPDSLVHFDLLGFGRDERDESWTFVSQKEGTAHVRHASRIVTSDVNLLLDGVLSELGIGLVPAFLCRELIETGQLIEPLPGWQGEPLAITLLTPPLKHPGATVSAIAAELGRHVMKSLRDGTDTDIRIAGNARPKLEPPVPVLNPASITRLSQKIPSVASHIHPRLLQPHGISEPKGDAIVNPILKKAAAAAVFSAASLLSMPSWADDAPGPIVLYTNDFQDVLQSRFAADTGRQVDVIQMSGGELLARIAAEGSNPQWDAVIFNGSNALFALDQQGQLRRAVEPRNFGNLNDVGRSQMPEDKSWFPIGLAASCVLTYRTDLVANPPAGFEDLTSERFNGKIGMADPAVAAPAYPCVAQIFYDLGKDKAQSMFSSIFSNGLRIFRTNAPVGRALQSGDISVALLTSQIAYTLKASGAPVDILWPKTGAPASVRGVGIQAKTKRPEAAQAFVEWLLEPATQKYLQDSAGADGLFEPTVAGASRRSDGPPEGSVYAVAPPDFAAQNEEAIKTWFADQAVH